MFRAMLQQGISTSQVALPCHPREMSATGTQGMFRLLLRVD
jgi:hypothetical protein